MTHRGNLCFPWEPVRDGEAPTGNPRVDLAGGINHGVAPVYTERGRCGQSRNAVRRQGASTGGPHTL